MEPGLAYPWDMGSTVMFVHLGKRNPDLLTFAQSIVSLGYRFNSNVCPPGKMVPGLAYTWDIGSTVMFVYLGQGNPDLLT